MCLNLSSIYSKKIAEEDIVCYKFLYLCKGCYYSPYWKTEWNVGEIKTDSNDWKIEAVGNSLVIKGRLTKGGFHSYSSLAQCLSRKYMYSYHVLAKCIIPKGTVYFKGVDDIGNDCYCSKSLKVEQIIWW